eukprot:gene42708-56773_t
MISLIHGVRGIYTGNVNAIHRLGIPSLNMEDGPQGFRTSKYTGPQGTTTAWPCSLAVASTWNLNLVHLWAEAMAKEFKIKGANVFLGPGVGVARVPYNGRIFEYLSGEDPYLGAKLNKIDDLYQVKLTKEQDLKYITPLFKLQLKLVFKQP